MQKHKIISVVLVILAVLMLATAFGSSKNLFMDISEGQNAICLACFYIYEFEKGDPDNGIPPGTPFVDLPDDWCCPICGGTYEHFKLKAEEEANPDVTFTYIVNSIEFPHDE